MELPGLFLLFTMYSFIGWICEVVYCSIPARHFINRGFLRGPVCPVYGFGALLVVFLLNPVKNNPMLLFICAVAVTSILEYATSWILETIFSTKWWDYSRYRFNIRGRVCLLNSVLFGILSVVMMVFVQPFLVKIIGLFSVEPQLVMAWLLAGVFVIDLGVTLKSLVNLDEKLAHLQELTEGLREWAEVGEWFSAYDLSGTLARLRAKTFAEGDAGRRIRKRFEALIGHSPSVARLIRAFPGMTSLKHGSQLELLKEEVRRRFEDTKAAKTASKADLKNGAAVRAEKKRASAALEMIHPADAGNNGTAAASLVSAAGQTSFVPSFAFGMNSYKLFWIFFLGCIAGTVIETIWCVFKIGVYQNRVGVIYGPFNPVYGVGAFLMTLCLSRLGKRRDLWIFLGSMLIGGLFEYFCSLGQELIFGTVSWEYSDAQMNLSGRTSIMYAFFWGILGLLWVKDFYPFISARIERIPNKIGKPLTWVLTVFMVCNMAVSALAVGRQSERRKGVPADNAVRSFLDRQYTDEFLKYKFPNMTIVEQASSGE